MTTRMNSDRIGQHYESAKRMSRSPGDQASPRFPRPPFSDCGMQVKTAFSFIDLRFLPPAAFPRESVPDAVKAGRVSAATEGPFTAARWHAECQGRQCLLSWYGSPDRSPWSGVVPSHHGIRRLKSCRSRIDHQECWRAVSAFLGLVTAGTRILSSRSISIS